MKAVAKKAGLMRWLPLALFALTASATAAGGSLFLRYHTPPPKMLVLTPKLEHYRAHAAQYDTVFIGTSRTQYHILPDTFEAAAASCGVGNVFNFGVFGLTGAEQDWLIEEVLKTGKGHLSTVILEEPLPETRSFADATNDRARFFQDPSLYEARVESAWSYAESPIKRVFRTGVFAYGAAFDLSGIGRAANVYFPEPAPKPLGMMDLGEDGFEALDELEHLHADIKARNDAFRADTDGFAQLLAAYQHPQTENTDARAHYAAAKLGWIERAGVRAAYFVSPDLKELDRTPVIGERVRGLAPGRAVLNFNRPDAYADLFARENWADYSHLNRRGARLLSAAAGAEFCAQEHLNEEPRFAVR